MAGGARWGPRAFCSAQEVTARGPTVRAQKVHEGPVRCWGTLKHRGLQGDQLGPQALASEGAMSGFS